MAWKWICISLKYRMVSWWFWYKNEIIQARLKSYGPFLNFLVLNVHIPAYLGSRGKSFLWDSEVFFVVSADRSLVQICIYKFTQINLYVNSFFYTIFYVRICIYVGYRTKKFALPVTPLTVLVWVFLPSFW